MPGWLSCCDPGDVVLRCLIVDDNDHFLAVARDLLERQGISVVGVASTSADALARVDDLRPDVTLVDIDLGQESGFDLARRLDAASYAQRPSVILISAYAEKDFADMIADSPAVAFLSKSDISGRAIHDILGSKGDRGRCGRS
ncbi:MAG: putative transcriptional regulator [Actinomycetia bacterium]|jgi:CheY-like chemotaxis protein|nr:putative transcriptional regulator [Actinomycetes bacterium]